MFCMSLTKILGNLKKRLFNNPEICARQIYESVIVTQPPEVIEYLKRLIYNHQSVSRKESPLVEEKPADSYSRFTSSLDNLNDAGD